MSIIYPPGVVTRAIAFEPVASIESGKPLRLEASTRASRSLVWGATGQEFFPAGAEVKTDIGGGEVLALPPTDLAGWVDPATGDVVDPQVGPTHTYATTVWVYDESGQVGDSYTVKGYELPSGVDPIPWALIRNLGLAPTPLSNGAQIIPLEDGQDFPPATPVGAWGITVNGNESFDLFQRTEAGKVLFTSVEIPRGGDGDPGADAYEVAVAAGFMGTREQWLASLHGDDGAPGDDGDSAYQLAVAAGFVGTEAEWRASLKGDAGISAYQVALANGYTGTQAQWLNSLHGADPTPQSYADALTAPGAAQDRVVYIAQSRVDDYASRMPLVPKLLDSTGATDASNALEDWFGQAASQVVGQLPAIPDANSFTPITRPLRIPHGTYRVDREILWPQGLSFVSESAIIRAGTEMERVIYTDPTKLMQNVFARGLIIDCAEKANVGIDLAYFSDVDVIEPTVVSAVRTGIRVGDPNASGKSYGGRIFRYKTHRRRNIVPAAGSIGLWARECTDTVFDDGGIMGYDYGVVNDGSSNLFRRYHPWMASGLAGPTGLIGPTASFKENGSKTVYDACYADTPGQYGWWLNGYETMLDNSRLFINAKGSDNVAVAFYVSSNYPYIDAGKYYLWGTRAQGAQTRRAWKADWVAASGTGLENVASDGRPDTDTVLQTAWGIRKKMPGLFLRGPSGWTNVQSQGNGGDQFQYLGQGSKDAGVTKDGLNRLASFTTANRPSASSVGAGVTIFDTNLGKPIFSNGTAWRDATGTAV